MTAILEAKNLKVIRGGSVLIDVPDLTIVDGEMLSLIGPNGAGKTTLLQALSYLTKPSAGDLLFRGDRVGTAQSPLEYRRRLAMVFQEPLLFDTTVLGNVAAGLKIRGISGAEASKIAEAQMDRFGITHLRDRSAKTLSGGEAQRTSLARAFAISPEVLFLDEPFAALDPPTRESVVTDLEKVLSETRITTIMATHDRNEALRLSDRIAVMGDGRIAQIDLSGAIMNHPVNEFVGSFVGTETILEGKIRNVRGSSIEVDVHGSQFEVVGKGSPGERVVLFIRPENVTISLCLPGIKTSARNTFQGTIERVVPLGLFYKLEISCGFPLVAYVTANSLDELSLKSGMPVSASIKATAIHFIRKILQ